MKRTAFIVIGAVLGAGVVAAGSIGAYEYFRYDDGREWIERTRATFGGRDVRAPLPARGEGAGGAPFAVEGDAGTPLSGGVERDDRAGGGSPSFDANSRAVLPLAQALEIAARHVPGEVLKVELDRDDGRTVYEIKVLAENGRVREIKFDAHHGEVIEIEDD